MWYHVCVCGFRVALQTISICTFYRTQYKINYKQMYIRLRVGVTRGKKHDKTRINTALKNLITTGCTWGSNNLKTTMRIKWLILKNKYSQLTKTCQLPYHEGTLLCKTAHDALHRCPCRFVHRYLLPSHEGSLFVIYGSHSGDDSFCILAHVTM
jgi:hypothetical protein